MLFVIYLWKSNVNHQKLNPFWAESQVVLILFQEECHSGGQELKQQFYLSSRCTSGFGMEDCCVPDAWIITWIMLKTWLGSYLWISFLMLSSCQYSRVRWREQEKMATWTITFLSKQTELATLEPLPIYKVLPTSLFIHLIIDIPGACVLFRRHYHYWLCVREETMSSVRSVWAFSAGVPIAQGKILATIIRIHSGAVGPSWSASEVPEWWCTSGSIHWSLTNALIQVWEDILLETIRSIPRCYMEGLQVIHTSYYWIHRCWISLTSQFFPHWF